jgi:hypothetical protein
MALTSKGRLEWVRRFLDLIDENPDAEIYINEDDELTLSYGPDTADEVEIGNRRKCHLYNLRERLADNDA